MGEQDKIHKFNLPGGKVIDYRVYPEEIFEDALQRVEGKYRLRFGKDVSEQDSLEIKQLWAMGVALGKDPFRVGRNYSETVNINGTPVRKSSVREAVDGFFLSGGRFSQEEIRFLKRNATKEMGRVREKINELDFEIPRKENPNLVPGDAEWTDPTRGVSGVGGHSSYGMNPDANPKGLGYDQGTEGINS